jgi:hypothetical protein
MSIEVVFFDVGEEGWAAYLGVSAYEFLKVLYETIERGDDHRRALEHFRPDLDLAAARRNRIRSGTPDMFDERDLYPDAQPCLSRLRKLGS